MMKVFAKMASEMIDKDLLEQWRNSIRTWEL